MVRLNEQEEELFKFLLEFVAEEYKNSVILRVAGGWVRDKVSNPPKLFLLFFCDLKILLISNIFCVKKDTWEELEGH